MMISKEFLLGVILSVTIWTSSAAEYVPGEPGGPWTQEELLIVKAKVWSLLPRGVAYRSYQKVVSKTKNAADFSPMPKEEWPKLDVRTDFTHFPAKLVRLAFHDCLKYDDKSGGCDGCMNFDGVGFRYDDQVKDKYLLKYNDSVTTNNNGLGFTVALLEELYTNPNYPSDTPQLKESLKSSGKSRADFWAFAAKVAVEYTTEVNNYLCEGRPTQWNGPYVGETSHLCQRYLNLPICKTVFDREIEFRYGRKDCKTPDHSYKAVKAEVQPNANGDGIATQTFFKDNFNFDARETVAIMGAHTLGRFNYRFSAFKYTWTTREGDLFNNRYYKNLIADGTSEYFLEVQDNKQCLEIGDADGKMGDVKWVPSYMGFTKGGGPIHWVKFTFACPQCKTGRPKNRDLVKEYDRCCIDVPEGKACKPDNTPRVLDNSSVLLIDNDDIDGCERYRFTFGLDEMACNAEMGLYYKFEVSETGIPKGCPGLEKFNMDVWKLANHGKGQEGRFFKQDKVPRRAYNPRCELQNTAGVVQEYADDGVQWLKDFTNVFEKMLANGYDAEKDLTLAPSSKAVCQRGGGKVTCTPA